jgi:CelD/BcsL family acetyltransferase involved in cellulose biosynthesis
VLSHRVIAGTQLTDELAERWRTLQASNPSLSSPYFCPEFTTLVARVRKDVQIAILERSGEVVGFFPFQHRATGVLEPVGGILSDHHGAIIAPGTHVDAVALIRACGGWLFDFDHLAAGQPGFEEFRSCESTSPIMELDAGFEAYCVARREAGSKKIKKTRGLARKLEREWGDVRFEADVQDSGVLDQVIEWKRAQSLRTGAYSCFSEPWAVELVREIQRYRSPGFGGLLSALIVRDRLVAAHFGMTSESVCHFWFPGYDSEFGCYSPGALLLLALAEFAAGQGLTTLDLGKGEDSYKTSFMSSALPLSEGSVIVPSLQGSLLKIRRGTDAFIRDSEAGAPIRASLRAGRDLVRMLRR